MIYLEDRSEFWTEFYNNGNDNWDLQGITPVFDKISDEIEPGAICILGCGRGYDAIMLAKKGFSVTAVDFSPMPVEYLREKAKLEKVNINVLQKDIFDLRPDYSETFDYIIEQTCFCAINPDRRKEYEILVKNLLKPGGQLLGLWFPLDKSKEAGGPPYATRVNEVIDLFSNGWKKVRDEFSPYTIEQRKNREKFIIFEKEQVK